MAGAWSLKISGGTCSGHTSFKIVHAITKVLKNQTLSIPPSAGFTDLLLGIHAKDRFILPMTYPSRSKETYLKPIFLNPETTSWRIFSSIMFSI